MARLDNDNTFFYKQNDLRCKESKVSRPLFCDLLISERCNLRCKKCYFWKHGIKNELTIEECKAFVLSLKDLVQPPFEINLGGGEPLLKEGIFDLSRYCADQGFQPAISTNGTLIDEEMAKRIFESGLHRLSLSLDTLDEGTHDFLTGTKGSYKRVMNAIDWLRKYCNGRVDLNIHSVILEQNIGQIVDLVEWVNNDDIFTGISFQALAQPFRTDLVDRWYLESEHSFLWPKDPKKVTSLIETLIKYKKQKYKILNPIPQLGIYKEYYENPEKLTGKHDCNFGEYIFNVNAFGYIHLCCFMEPVGDIRKIDIKDAWCSEKAQETRKRMHNCQKSCNNIVNCYFQEGGKIEEEATALIEDGVEKVITINEGVKKIRSLDIKPASIASADLLVASYCMLKCKMCYLWERKRDPGELRIEEWKQLVSTLRLITGDKFVRLHFGGGEPLLKEDISDLIKFSTQKGFYTLVTTNGFLIDKEMAHKISDSGLSHITISLDSVKEEVHDYLRGVKGTYRRVFNAFDYLSQEEKKISIGVNCLISDVNLDGILPLARWAIDDERISGIIFQAVVQPYETAFEHEWHKNSVFSELWPKDNDKVERIIDQLIDLKANTQKGKKITNSIGQFKVFKEYFRNPYELIEKKTCPMDGSSLLVNWKGDAYFCGLLKPIGNLRHVCLEDIMASDLAEERSIELKRCRRNCNNKVNCFYKDE